MFKWLAKLSSESEENHQAHEEFREQLVDKDRWLTELLIDLDLNDVNSLMEVAKINGEKNKQEAITAILKYCKPIILKMVEEGKLYHSTKPQTLKQMDRLFGENYRQAFEVIDFEVCIFSLYSKGILIQKCYAEKLIKGKYITQEYLVIRLLDKKERDK